MADSNVEIKYTQIFINNKFVDSASGLKFTCINPHDETIIAEISHGDKV